VEEAGNRDDTIFVGGPVQQNTLQFIHKNDGID
jgi:putative AlgH/UPF0301 family transcriptional regulator